MVLETLVPVAQDLVALLEPFGITPVNLVSGIVRVLIVLVAWFFTSRYVANIAKFLRQNGHFMNSMEKIGINERKYGVVHSLWKIGVYLVFIFFSLYILGLTPLMYTLLTAAGVMGIVIGFAVQEIASNMVSGLIIKINQPFDKGDGIGVDGEYLGTVKKVSFYSTTVNQLNGTHLIIPNKSLITKPLVNYSITKKRRIDVKVSVLADNDIDKALQILEKIAKNEKARIESEEIEAYVNNIEYSFVVLELRFWVGSKEHWGVKKLVMKRILDEFKKNKIKLPIPITNF